MEEVVLVNAADEVLGSMEKMEATAQGPSQGFFRFSCSTCKAARFFSSGRQPSTIRPCLEQCLLRTSPAWRELVAPRGDGLGRNWGSMPNLRPCFTFHYSARLDKE
jgi:hypothetical protein